MEKIEPLYFITFTTYGTWLHGDRRGSVNDRQNRLGEEFIQPNPALENYSRSIMSDKPLYFSDAMRQVVLDTIAEVAKYRKWMVHAANVQKDHLHILILANDKSPDDVMKTLKAYATRRLRESHLVQSKRNVWTEGGSTRWVKTSEQARNVIRYILYKQSDARYIIGDCTGGGVCELEA